jgi:hypothetical protein
VPNISGLAELDAAIGLAVFVGGPLLIAWLLVGVAFHATVAGTMGLHLFIWTFGATYPVLLFIAMNVLGRAV